MRAEANGVRQKRTRDAQRAYVVAMKGGKCEICGAGYDPEMYDFHSAEHNADKRVGNLYGMSLKKVVDEAKRCALLCPNCHRAVHIALREEKGESYAPK